MSAFTKPAKLDQDCMWVAVAEIHESDGHGPDERTWGEELLGRGCSTETAARLCAVDWFNQTGQAETCDVTFSVERADGTIVRHRIVVGPEIVAKVHREVKR